MERPTGLEPETTCITIRGSCIVSSYLKGFYSTRELLPSELLPLMRQEIPLQVLAMPT